MNYREARVPQNKLGTLPNTGSQSALRNMARGSVHSLSSVQTPNQGSQKGGLQPAQSFKRIPGKVSHQLCQNSQQNEEPKGAPLSTLSLNLYNNRPQAHNAGDTAARASKTRPSVLPGRVSNTWKNIQPIRKQVKEYNQSKVASMRSSNSLMKKKAMEKASWSGSSAPSVELKNCKGPALSRSITCKQQRGPVRGQNDLSQVQMGNGRKQQASRNQFNGDLTLTSPDVVSDGRVAQIAQCHPDDEKENDSSLERENPKEHDQGKSGQSSCTEDGDAYCVDDDEDDDLERDEQDDEQSSQKDEDQLSKRHEMTVESRRNDQTEVTSKDGAFFSAQDPQAAAISQDSQLPTQEVQQDQSDQQESTRYSERDRGMLAKIGKDVPTAAQLHRVNAAQGSTEDLKSRNTLTKSLATTEDVITVKKDLDASMEGQKAATRAEAKSKRGSQERLDASAVDKHSSSNAESSTIKTNQTPIKYQDKNFLLPMKSSEKKFDKMQQQILNDFTLEQQEDGAGDAATRNKVLYPAAESSITAKSNCAKDLASIYTKETMEEENSHNQSNCVQPPEGLPKPHRISTSSELVGQSRNPEGQVAQPSLLKTHDQASQTPTLEDPLSRLGSKLDMEHFKKYEQSLELPLDARGTTQIQKSGASTQSLHISVDYRRKSSADQYMSNKLNSTVGARSVQSAYSSQVSKTTSNKAADSPFQAVLAHQPRSQNFSFPKDKRGLLPVEGQRTSQRDLQPEVRKGCPNRNEQFQETKSTFASKKFGNQIPIGPFAGKKSATTVGPAKSPRFNDGRRSRSRSSVSSMQNAQRNDQDLQLPAENERSCQALIKQQQAPISVGFQAPLASQKQIPSAPTQESMKSAAMLQSSHQISLPTTQQVLIHQSNQGMVPDIDSGEQLVGELTDEGSLDDTHKRQQVFNQTTTLQASAASLARFDCKSNKMFNSASIQSSTSAAPNRLPLVVSNQSAGKMFTLRQIAQQAIANSLDDPHYRKRRSQPHGQGLTGEKANSHTSGTATYYVDDVSSSPNNGNSLSQTEQKILLTFSNTDKLMCSHEYGRSSQFRRRATRSNLREDLGVCNFEVTLQTQEQETDQVLPRNRPLSDGRSEGAPPQPSYLTCLPHTQNKELTRVQQRILEEEQRLLRAQMEIEQQKKEFKGQVAAQKLRQQQSRGKQDHQQSVHQRRSTAESRQPSVNTYDGNSCEQTTQYNHTNSNSLQTAKFNEHAQASIHSCQDATQWLADNSNYYGTPEEQECPEDGQGAEVPIAFANQQMPCSPGPQEYVTANGFDERIDLIGHGEIKNMESTQNADSSALSNTLPFRSQNLNQIFKDMKSQNADEERPEEPNGYVRSDEEIIQEALKSIASHLPDDAATGAAAADGLTGQQCMNYNDYLQLLHNKRSGLHNTGGSLRNSTKSSGAKSLKRSSCSSQQMSMRGWQSGSKARKKEYAPVLRNESRASGSSKATSKMQSKKGAASSKRVEVPRWNSSTNTASGHRRNKSQAAKQSRKAAEDGQPHRLAKTHHIVCHARSRSGHAAKGDRPHQPPLSKKSSTWSMRKRDARSRPERSANRASPRGSAKQRRKRSNSKKSTSHGFQLPAQPISHAPANADAFDYQLESQTLEMSYMQKEMRQAQNEEVQARQQLEEVREMFNGRKQVYVNIDNGHAGQVQQVVELPLGMEAFNYYDQADEQFQSTDFYNCQGHPPLTFESKMSHGGLQRQLLESFVGHGSAAQDRGQVVQEDSLDLRGPHQNQSAQSTIQERQIEGIADFGNEQQVPSQQSLHAQHQGANGNNQGESHDFFHHNRLGSYAEHAFVGQHASEMQEDLYDCQFDENQVPSHHDLQNPQVLHMIQRANQVAAGRHEEHSHEERQSDFEDAMLQEQPEEACEATEEKSRPLSASQTPQSRSLGEQKIASDGTGAGRKRKALARTRGLNSMKLDFNPLPTALGDYIKVVKQRVNHRQRRCNSTDYQRRFMSHTRLRPPLNGDSSMCRSQQSLTRRGKKRGASSSYNLRASHRRSGSNNRISSLERNGATLDTEQSLSHGKFRAELQEKRQLQSLKAHLARQKQHERQLLEKHNLIKKQQITQTKKQVGLLQNKNQQMFDRMQKKQQAAERTAAERKIIATNQAGEGKLIEGTQKDLRELQRLRQTLNNEIEVESQLVDDIRGITHKYKRLLAEQTREKEKLVQTVRGQQQKILKNLKDRREVLREDNAKLFTEFKSTMNKNGARNEKTGSRSGNRTGSRSRASSKGPSLKKSQSLSRKSSSNRVSSTKFDANKSGTSATRLHPSYIR